jgi:hypothetical protein
MVEGTLEIGIRAYVITQVRLSKEPISHESAEGELQCLASFGLRLPARREKATAGQQHLFDVRLREFREYLWRVDPVYTLPLLAPYPVQTLD